MRDMFYNCKLLQSLGLRTWDVNNVTDMMGMFEHCRNLQSLDLTSWDVNNVIYMDSMFGGCYKLQRTYGMSGGELEEALRSGNWPALPTKQSNDPQKIKF